MGVLTLLIVLPIAGVLLLLVPPYGNPAGVRRVALLTSVITGCVAVWALVQFYQQEPRTVRDDLSYVLEEDHAWLSTDYVTKQMLDGRTGEVPTINIRYHVGVDGISIWMIALSAFLMPLAIWGSFSAIRERPREYYCLLLLLQAGLMGVFCAMDLLLFYVCFEFTLIPLYFLIGIWGGPDRKRAASKFFIYTLAGSVLTFAGVIFLAFFSYEALGHVTLDIEELTQLGQTGILGFNLQWWLFLAFAAGFAIKVPLFPFHTWLPLAHTEAPTAGSVILAGVLLKLGTYGFCRLSIPMFPEATFFLAPFVATLAIIGIIYAALAAWVQTDVKKLVAYSSVSHLGYCILGLFSLKVAGVTGGVIYMINHGLSTAALFLVIGCVYERYHTRDIRKIGGLAKQMPMMAFFLVFFTLCSIGLPGLNGFIGEFLVLLGTATSSTMKDGLTSGPLGFGYVIPAALGIILGAVYMLWMCRCVLFGPLNEPPNTPDTSAGLTKDLTRREIGILTPIAIACVVLGVYPKPVLDTIEIAARDHVLRAPYVSDHPDADEPLDDFALLPPPNGSALADASLAGSVGGDSQ
jgi:NADH-quinone oxidoreductase subunit M